MMVARSLLALAIIQLTAAFQFMKGWKMPTYDPNQEAVEQKFGDKKLVVLTGASSGLGRKTAMALLRSGEYHVIGAVRDLDKMDAVAEIDGFDMENFTPMYCELNSFDSVREFCSKVDEFRMSKPIDRLICNAGIYQPSLPYAKWSLDNHEQTMQVNYLSHFLMISKFMDSMKDSTDPRVIMVGSVTGNDNTVGGGGVYPIADLHDLDGFKAGFENPIAMADGYGFIGAKAYKDSKLCLMMMANFLHYKYHKLTGISFCSMYPGCIAESPLFREKRAWFRKYFPVFMKFITGGFVGEHEAGQRLFQVAHDPRCSKSGVYWSWNGGPREGRGLEAIEKGGQISGGGGAGGGWDSIFENDQSAKVLDIETALKLFDYSNDITGAEWPEVKAVRSPCPTLNVISAVTKGMVKREELKRMREMGRPGFENGEPIKKLSRRKKAVIVADRVASRTLKHTVGRAARFVGRRVLGRIPEEALQGSFYEAGEAPKVSKEAAPAESIASETLKVITPVNEVEREPKQVGTVADHTTSEVASAHSPNEVLAETLPVADQKTPEIEVSEQVMRGEEAKSLEVPSVLDAEDEALIRQIYNEQTEATAVPVVSAGKLPDKKESQSLSA